MKILVVVDMQNDFIDGSLKNPETKAIVGNIVNKIKAHEDKGNFILVTRDTHYDDYLQTQEGKKLPVPHCIINTLGWDINDQIKNALKDHENVVYIDKNTFGSINLADFIKEKGEAHPEEKIEVEMVGVCTDICVVSNALITKAFLPEVEITVDSSCCAGITPESHEAALTTMKMCQINII